MRRLLLSLALLAIAVPAAPEAAPARIPTPRGVDLEARLTRPETPNGGAVVLAPGRGYHMERPLLQACAAKLAAAGFLAVRFDWAYTTAKGEPAPDLRTEFEDMDAAIAFAGKQPGITRVILAGKSMGSILAVIRGAAKSDDLAGVALLTFPAAAGGPSDGMPKIAVPVAVITGDADPICPRTPLYEVAARCERPPFIVIVPGDHSFRQDEDEAKEKENVAFAADALVLWAKRLS